MVLGKRRACFATNTLKLVVDYLCSLLEVDKFFLEALAENPVAISTYRRGICVSQDKFSRIFGPTESGPQSICHITEIT